MLETNVVDNRLISLGNLHVENAYEGISFMYILSRMWSKFQKNVHIYVRFFFVFLLVILKCFKVYGTDMS